jgi:glycosyltransferase involved in cell wall biosynthesis
VKIFLAGTSLLPSYGGPALSVSRLAVALAEAGAGVGLWASDQSAATSPLLSSRSCVQRLTGRETEALERFGPADILHDNGIWLPHNHRLAVLAKRRRIPRVVSTRGMLEPWALRHKRVKKAVAWTIFQERDLRQAGCHHATSEVESRNVQALGLGVPVTAVPNGVDVPEKRDHGTGAESGRTQTRLKTALFLGRIYPVKGLPMLIEAWARVRPNGWVLRVAGPNEAGHQKQVEKAVSKAGLGEVVSFLGPISHAMKDPVFMSSDLFVLPSYSENFGMAVAEALAHGLPVLTTTGTPWPMLPEIGCGWWVDPTVDGLEQGLRQATTLDAEALQEMGEKGRALIYKRFTWKHIANLMLSMYTTVLESATT